MHQNDRLGDGWGRVRARRLIEWVGAVGLFAGSVLFLSFLVARRRGTEATGLRRVGIWLLLVMWKRMTHGPPFGSPAREPVVAPVCADATR